MGQRAVRARRPRRRTASARQIWAAADRGDITPEQAPLVVRSLLTAGVDTTVHGLSAVLYAFATHPDQWRRLRAEPALARVAFDEAMRWESPVQTFFRTATTDVRVGDHVVPDGKKILMFLGAANRDPRRWDAGPGRASTSAATPRGMSASAWASTSASVSTSPGSRPRPLAHRPRPAGRAIELDGPTRRHHNNTLRAWESMPVRLTRHPKYQGRPG